jgi:hypothetical protein
MYDRVGCKPQRNMQPCSKVVRRGTILTVYMIYFHKICKIIT